MNPWFDGLYALTDHIAATLLFLFVVAWGMLVMRGTFFRLFGDSLDEIDSLSLSAAGWAIPALILSFITFTVSTRTNAIVAGVLALILILLSIFILPGRRPQPIHILIALALSIPILILRFAFICDLLLPSYFDSAEHYRLIRLLVETHQTGISIDILNGGYYHLGFHHMLASLAYFFQVEIADLMLASGPVLLALLPLTFYFIVKRETYSHTAALFACLLAGFGFHMPAHLMNWGKYPALLGLLFIPLVLSVGSMLYHSDPHRKRVLVLLSFAVLVSTLIHSRTLVVFGLMLPAALLTLGWDRLHKPYRIPGFILPVALLATELFFIQQNPALKTLIGSYPKNDSPILILLPSLILLSAYHFPRPTFFLLSWLTLCALCLFIPISIPAHGIQTLLDRPFVQMFAVVPLSLLGGLGCSGATRAFARLIQDRVLIQRFVIIFLFGFVFLNAALTYDLYPSECCRFVTRDDLAAFTWMDESTPPDAKILIASAGLYVTSLEPPESQTGVDAGIWIPPLLSRPIELLGADIRFDLADTHKELCQNNVEYIYVGGMPQSFDSAQLDNCPDWYLPAFALPSARVYRLTGCGV